MRWLATLWRWIAGSSDSSSAVAPAPESQTTRPAEWSDVDGVVVLLEKHGVEYVLIGGYALFANGLARLGELPDGAAKALSGEDRPFPLDDGGDAGTDSDSAPGVIRINDVITVDVMPRASGLSYDDLKPHIARISRDGREMNVLNLEGLLRTKQGLRPKDQADRQVLEQAISRRPGR